MNLHAKLRIRAAQQKPISVALIGAGKFGSMFLTQAIHTPGMHITGIADLSSEHGSLPFGQEPLLRYFEP